MSAASCGQKHCGAARGVSGGLLLARPAGAAPGAGIIHGKSTGMPALLVCTQGPRSRCLL